MAWYRVDGMGGQGIADVSTTQQHPLGFEITAQNATGQLGKFVYVIGVASGAAGLAVTINRSTGATALTGARSKGVLGVLQSALDATTDYGWAQVWGPTDVQVATAAVAGSSVYLSGTAGKLDDAVVAGDQVFGATFATADGTPTANWARLSMSYAFVGDTDNA